MRNGHSNCKVSTHHRGTRTLWFEEEFSAIILFSSAHYTEPMRWKSAWYLLMKAVSEGAGLITLARPQDDEDWGRNMNLLRDFIEETSAQRPILRQRLRCLLPLRSQNFSVDAPFKTLVADKITWYQSAVKRFWYSTLRAHSLALCLPEFHLRPFQERNNDSHQHAYGSQRGYLVMHKRNRSIEATALAPDRERSLQRNSADDRFVGAFGRGISAVEALLVPGDPCKDP
ncbi:hypothetical protein COOONC_00933 [Cooperia oncophora]